MGHAPKFKDAIDKIDENSNEGEQTYEIVFYQWGRVINLVFFQITVLEDRSRRTAGIEFENCDMSDYDCFVNSYEDLDKYDSYSKAIQTVSKMVPSEFFQQENSLTMGDKWASIITIASGLGIAFVLDMQRNHINLNPALAFIPEGDAENELNLLSLISETEENIKLKVGDHNFKRVETLKDAWEIFKGFKDGIAGVTGSDSKFYLCNSNITVAEDVYWYNGYRILGPPNIEARFTPENEDQSMIELMGYIKLQMQWPYNTLYNCYWAGYELYTPQIEKE